LVFMAYGSVAYGSVAYGSVAYGSVAMVLGGDAAPWRCGSGGDAGRVAMRAGWLCGSGGCAGRVAVRVGSAAMRPGRSSP
jgi:hypothetical protein